MMIYQQNPTVRYGYYLNRQNAFLIRTILSSVGDHKGKTPVKLRHSLHSSQSKKHSKIQFYSYLSFLRIMGFIKNWTYIEYLNTYVNRHTGDI